MKTRHKNSFTLEYLIEKHRRKSMKDFYVSLPEYAKAALVMFLTLAFSYFGVPLVMDSMDTSPPAVVESE